MRKAYLKDLQAGDLIDDVYIIANKQLSATTSGKYFIKAFVGDRTTQLNARMWNATRETFNAIPEAGYLKIRGRIENYQNNLQLIIEQIWAAKDGTYDMADLMPHTQKNIDQMFRQLVELCGTLQNRHVKALIQAFLDDKELMANFRVAPAAMNFHHAFVGGLLEHTLNAMEVGSAVVPFYPGLNRDLCLAGILLHDLAKTWELKYDSAFGYTDGGQLVGHIVKAAMWVNEKAKVAEQIIGEKIPQPVIDVLHHIILSHHGVPEFGAVKTPATPEAIFVHMIENLDAKMMMSLAATRGEPSPGAEGNWTEYMKAFGGRLYRPDVAPADSENDDEREEPSLLKPNTGSDSVLQRENAKATMKVEITNPLFESMQNKRK